MLERPDFQPRQWLFFGGNVLSRIFFVALWMLCLRMGCDWVQAAESGATKPSVGAVLNPQHPLGSGLIVCPLLNEGAGQSLWDSGTRQSFIMDNPLVWVSLPQTLQYPWAGPALQFSETPGTGQIGRASCRER